MVASSPPDASSEETSAHDCPRSPLSPPSPPRSAWPIDSGSTSAAEVVPSSTSDSRADARATDPLLVAPTNLSPGETRTPSQRTIYLVRHAESRYNDATKNLSIRKIVGEYDHGLSTKGVDQCIALRNRIIEAAECGDADALGIVNRDVTYSSPLSRAVLTARLSLPEMATKSDRKVKVRQDVDTGGQKQQGEKRGQERRSTVVIVIPDAREHCMLPVLSRDSIGTVKEKLNYKLSAELDDIRANYTARAEVSTEAKVKDGNSNEDEEVQKAVAVPVLDPNLLDPESFFVDTSHLTKSTWWKVGESGSDVTRRLQGLIRQLYDLSSDVNGDCGDDAGNDIFIGATPSDKVNENGTMGASQVEDQLGRKSTVEGQGKNRTGGAVVLVGHSHVFRRLFREFGESLTCDPNTTEDRTDSHSQVSTFSNGNADGTAAATERDAASNGSNNNNGSKSLIIQLGKQMITNCAVLRVNLSLKHGMDSPTIVNAAFLFGTGFKNNN